MAWNKSTEFHSTRACVVGMFRRVSGFDAEFKKMRRLFQPVKRRVEMFHGARNFDSRRDGTSWTGSRRAIARRNVAPGEQF
jgi:hypothetical protein